MQSEELANLKKLAVKAQLVLNELIERIELIESREIETMKLCSGEVALFGQFELFADLYNSGEMKKLIYQLNQDRRGGPIARKVIAATFPKDKFVTEQTYVERMRAFGLSTGPEPYYKTPSSKKVDWCEEGKKDSIPANELLDFNLFRLSKKRKPSWAICMTSDQREDVDKILREKGYEKLADILRDKT